MRTLPLSLDDRESVALASRYIPTMLMAVALSGLGTGRVMIPPAFSEACRYWIPLFWSSWLRTVKYEARRSRHSKLTKISTTRRYSVLGGLLAGQLDSPGSTPRELMSLCLKLSVDLNNTMKKPSSLLSVAPSLSMVTSTWSSQHICLHISPPANTHRRQLGRPLCFPASDCCSIAQIPPTPASLALACDLRPRKNRSPNFKGSNKLCRA